MLGSSVSSLLISRWCIRDVILEFVVVICGVVVLVLVLVFWVVLFGWLGFVWVVWDWGCWGLVVFVIVGVCLCLGWWFGDSVGFNWWFVIIVFVVIFVGCVVGLGGCVLVGFLVVGCCFGVVIGCFVCWCVGGMNLFDW